MNKENILNALRKFLDLLVDIFFQTLEDMVSNITLPTGDSLIPTFTYAFIITILSAFSKIVCGTSCWDWRGALIATILLLGVAIIERRGVSEISRLYRAVKSGATTLKKRAEGSGAPFEAVRGTNPGDEMHEEIGGPSDSAGKMQ